MKGNTDKLMVLMERDRAGTRGSRAPLGVESQVRSFRDDGNEPQDITLQFSKAAGIGVRPCQDDNICPRVKVQHMQPHQIAQPTLE